MPVVIAQLIPPNASIPLYSNGWKPRARTIAPGRLPVPGRALPRHRFDRVSACDPRLEFRLDSPS